LVIEPLAQLYKDEVRQLGESLGIPRDLIWRHPFPGPGLGVRLLCSDGTVQPFPENAQAQLEALIAPTGYQASLLPLRSVGVQGDERTYAHPVLIEGPRDWQALDQISTRITNSVRSVNRVIFRLTGSDQPSTLRLVKSYVTHDRLEKLRAIDAVVTRALQTCREYDTVWQMPVVMLPLVDRQERSCIVLRPIVSQEAMTARFHPLRNETLDTIIREASGIHGIGDLFFDITHKPPGTIEWE
jgi:GMP synthase (glutamine-hydrolysing)